MDTTIRLNTRLVGNMSKALYMPAAEIVAATGMNRSTWYRIVESPHILTVQQLLVIANTLHIPARRFFLTDDDDVIGKREDYVAEPYQECSYDADMLQSTVESRPDLSWQQAAEATGVTRDNLRLSLLGITHHTPVIRFLKACQAWEMDPFTVLIDPNPDPPKPEGRRDRRDHQGLRAEIDALRKDVRSLGETVDGLKRMYEELQKAHAALARRVSVNFENVNGSHISIADNELMPPEPDK